MLGEVLTAIVTPFDANGAVNYERFRELATHLVENGSDGLVVAGTTGESPTLSDDERLELVAAAVDTVAGGVMFDSVAHNSTPVLEGGLEEGDHFTTIMPVMWG